MRRLIAAVIATLIAAVLAPPASACLWDYDTLRMERERFPGTLELIVGKFLRHSDAFYEWRIEDRQAKLAAHDAGHAMLSEEEMAQTYDDLAVAFDKLGRHQEAIATIQEKAHRLPDVGRYETHANLGTFLIHAGRFEEGIAELNHALAINPQAHFGREKYQVRLVEYVLTRRSESPEGESPELPLPLSRDPRHSGSFPPFAAWLLEREGLATAVGTSSQRTAAEAELDRATHAVLGMMRFGDFRSPVLLEALGDLLLARQAAASEESQREGNPQRLAARAYLRAAERAEAADVKAAYRRIAADALTDQLPDRKAGEQPAPRQTHLALESLEDQLRREIREADDWFATVAHEEAFWIRVGTDVDQAFWRKYGDQEVRVGRDRLPAGRFAMQGLPPAMVAAIALGAILTLAFIAGLIQWRRHHPGGDRAEQRPVGAVDGPDQHAEQ